MSQPRKFKRIEWAKVCNTKASWANEMRDRYAGHITGEREASLESVKSQRVYCVDCNVDIYPKISTKYWAKWLTVKEQEHIYSPEHEQSLLLARLEG